MSFLEKIYLGDRRQVIKDIFEKYASSKSVFVNYLYFANVMHQRLLEDPENQEQKKYYKALEHSDFLLADGIALQLFYRFGIGRKSKMMPENLNGTDLFPEILSYLSDQQKQEKKIHMAWYTLYDDAIGKSQGEARKAEEKILEDYGLKVNFLFQEPYIQRGKKFDWEKYNKSLGEEEYDIRLFCNFIGTPIQEIWGEKHYDFFQRNHVLVLNQGGTIDFLSGFEKRAPHWIKKSRILETPWRICSKPKKNFKKFLWMFGIVRYWLFVLRKIFLREKTGKSSGK